MTESIHSYQKYGDTITVFNYEKTYGDFLFKKPLLNGLKSLGFKIYTPHSENSAPFLQKGWAIILNRKDSDANIKKIIDSYTFVIQIERFTRKSERVSIWHDRKNISQKTFRRKREQERIRAIANYLDIPYKERVINIQFPNNKKILLNFSVIENQEKRSAFNYTELSKVLHRLHQRGYSFSIIENTYLQNPLRESTYSSIPIQRIKTKDFSTACKVMDKHSYYLGLDAGLGHYAVSSGKIAFTIYNKHHHGESPLFQTTFRNHFCYFGNQNFADKLLSDISNIDSVTSQNRKIIQAMENFISFGKTLCPDPYANERKLFALRIGLAFHSSTSRKLIKTLHQKTSNIFFPDRIIEYRFKNTPPNQPIFLDSNRLIQRLSKEVSSHPKAKEISLYAKPCSIFYQTALNNHSSDIDLLTLYAPNLTLKEKLKLLYSLQKILIEFNLSTELPHQSPRQVSSPSLLSELSPIIINGSCVFETQTQKDTYNLDKYQARVKIKYIFNEIKKYPTHKDTSLRKELDLLAKHRSHFPAYKKIIRNIQEAISLAGKFGSTAQIIIHIPKEEWTRTFCALSELEEHKIISLQKSLCYPLWDIRRPQHGWFQPILLLPEQEKNKTPLKYFKNIESEHKALSKLESPNPLEILMGYRTLSSNNCFKNNFKTNFHIQNKIQPYITAENSNCNTPNDQMLSLWSMATGKNLTTSSKERQPLSKYNLFAETLASGFQLEISKTSFLSIKKPFSQPHLEGTNLSLRYIKNLTRLLREYYLYTLCIGIPKEILYEKKKEILFSYIVQGGSLFEGPSIQAKEVKSFLNTFDIQKVLSDGRALRNILTRTQNIKTDKKEGLFLLSWLLKRKKQLKSYEKKLGHDPLKQSTMYCQKAFRHSLISESA